MKNVKWIKVCVDIFEDEKILLIESKPKSDEILNIWFKILTLAGKINNGGVLMLDDNVAYTEEMLATIFRRSSKVVKRALRIFKKLGMVEIINDTIVIPNWSKHQSLDQLQKKNKYMKNYMREYRKKQADLALGIEEEIDKEDLPDESLPCKTNSKVNSKSKRKSNVSYLDIEGELEEELELEEDIYKDVVSYLNEKASKNYRPSTTATRRYIKARVNEGFSLDDFKAVIDTKSLAWKNDKKMSPYLRPSTLFGTKFESYLNEKDTKTSKEYGW